MTVTVYQPGDMFATMSVDGRATLYTVSTSGEPLPLPENTWLVTKPATGQ